MSVLDLDFYKLTMLQFIWKHYADVPVTFRLHSRKQDLADIVSPTEAYRHIKTFLANTGLTGYEREYLNSLGIFEDRFLDDLHYMLHTTLAVPRVDYDGGIEVSGDWFKVSLWETVVLAAVSERYSTSNVDQPSDIKRFAGIHDIEQSGAKWADFGTRRRWSRHNHGLLLARLAEEKRRGNLEGFIGTSNVMMARALGLNPIGTYAHELEMVLRNVFPSEWHATRAVLKDWGDMYPRDLRIALTDTYTTPNFLEQHGKFLLDNDWRGVRLDSGDPFVVGQAVEMFIANRGQWDVVFSDGLDARAIIRLQQVFRYEKGINPVFGWGTGLTNPNSDLSLVMKATEANGQPTYKTTDDAEKSIR